MKYDYFYIKIIQIIDITLRSDIRFMNLIFLNKNRILEFYFRY